MACVTMTQISATLCKPVGSTVSPCTISWNSRSSDRSGLSRMPKGRPKARPNRQRGQGSQCVCQRQDQRDD
eukprot:10587700-Ditylum_brightwellii.AAC.1